jgi:hypothetical protein
MKYRLLCIASKIVYKLYLLFYGVCHKLGRLHYRIYIKIFREDEVNNG